LSRLSGRAARRRLFLGEVRRARMYAVGKGGQDLLHGIRKRGVNARERGAVRRLRSVSKMFRFRLGPFQHGRDLHFEIRGLGCNAFLQCPHPLLRLVILARKLIEFLTDNEPLRPPDSSRQATFEPAAAISDTVENHRVPNRYHRVSLLFDCSSVRLSEWHRITDDTGRAWPGVRKPRQERVTILRWFPPGTDQGPLI
jgi:hypothetical protein